MPYAIDDRISKAPLAGGAEISEQEYNQAREHLMSGKLVKVHGEGKSGQIILTEKPEKRPDHQDPVWQDGKWIHEPIAKEPETPEQIAAKIPGLRKEKEAEGVTVNGIRYAGDESNRQALREAIDYTEDAGETEFPVWKDSDDEYHQGHPLADVKGAYRAIGRRRSELIGLEGQYVAQALAGELTDLDGLEWP